jgi:hypothetical protein
MLKVVDFDESFIDEIETGFDFPAEMRAAFHNKCNMFGYGIMRDNQVVAVGGVYELWSGVGEAWMVMSKHAYNWRISIARYSRILFNSIMQTSGLHRIQASINELDVEAIRYARWIGLEDEGMMNKYGPDGTNYYRMAMVL